MSTPPVTGPHDGERRKTLGRYVKRMSSVFKREKSSKSEPQASSVAAPTTSAAPSAVPREEAATQEVAKAQSIRQELPTDEPAAAPIAAAVHLTATTSVQALAPAPAPVSFTPVVDRNAMQLERARALFARYGLTLESDDLFKTGASAPLVPRVEKAIRMRVHRSCHKCGTLYGHDKVCMQCEHKRCKQCPRYPKKKTAGEKKEKEVAEQPKKKKVLTVTTRNGCELVYQPATQRVRRICHKCEAFFVPPTATTCESCNHVRCTKCPREPAKRNKWPSGYPGDVAADSEDDIEDELQLDQFRRIWRKPRRVVRWECEQCHSLFRQGSPQCPGCGHGRCDHCTRSPIKKLRQEESFDPAVVAAVEAKLRALGVDSDPPTSEPEHV
ncbi:uncharacterized protein M421DRAFT_424898 [Didymella exigua CBS 183.55]|uniref:Uncharacterized protein n=1 Tax=Didymella exigua CBS 183.55 TaxID=1150837 RepID=A0A6A5RAN8_9PLEO|nr:uncharacterized protein M421DRAFT_424898 [Didymella exigua CBS 183.55]KAF1924258.1 hypothetical protein M421DRAFT_424898 [Didymella exigua CBS 183.55]